MALSRISITLPRDVLVAADRRARALDRSRSWLIVEALRAYLATPARSASAGIREPDAPVYAAREVADARRQVLPAGVRDLPRGVHGRGRSRTPAGSTWRRISNARRRSGSG